MYDKQIEENRAMINGGRLMRSIDANGRPRFIVRFSGISPRPFVGRVELIEGAKKNRLLIGLGWGVLLIVGAAVFMALMLF